MTTDPIKRAWQASVAEGTLPPLETLTAASRKFYRMIRMRNAIELGACVFVVLAFGYYAFVLPVETVRIGAAAVVGGTFVVGWQLIKRASALAPPDSDLVAATLAHQRAQAVRQRDALRSIFWWYLLPLIPGLLLMLFGAAIERGGNVLRALQLRELISFAAATLVFGGIWWLNRRAAAMLQAKIDELDALTGEGQ